MSLDFQQVKQQITEMGEGAIQKARALQQKRQEAMGVLNTYANQSDQLHTKVSLAIQENKNLRCALPGTMALNFQSPRPKMPEKITILAADGSQINPDLHASIDFCLVNVGAVQMTWGISDPPSSRVETKLMFDDQLYTTAGRITERMVALMRDLGERHLLAVMAEEVQPPIITLTDGPLELWVGREGNMDNRIYDQRFQEYLDTLKKLARSGASTAGYIDRPRGDLLVRLLEIANLPSDKMNQAGRSHRPFFGVTDTDLFDSLLPPGQRSAIFGIQTRTSEKYPADLALHFFYLNVSQDEKQPYTVRVEIPAWVVKEPLMVDDLHAVLVQQCQVLGTRTYPYLLHRSHEVALVSQEEKNQVETMIALEMSRRGFSINERSHKQAAKDLPGRTRL